MDDVETASRRETAMLSVKEACDTLRNEGQPPAKKFEVVVQGGVIAHEGRQPLLRQTVLGNIPSKSNCYKIITLPGKKPDPIKEDCPACNGKQRIFSIATGNSELCQECKGIGFFMIQPERKSHSSLGKASQLKEYEKAFFMQCGLYRNMNLEGYFELEVDVYYPSQRSDLDNCLKILLDCLQAVNAIPNDNKCTRIVANKFIDKEKPRIEFVLKPAM